MEKGTDSEDNARYNDEVLFLDGIIESHPEVYVALPREDRAAIQLYYLVGQPVPENIFNYRKNLVFEDPEIQHKAESAFRNLLEMLGVQVFDYSTKFRGSTEER